ncbi:hypothetical protein BC835DRAFT_1421694 [Cytidiella melzeri]|nr:hypothetical protein BC835DRAFT_1421694 [Cytidiella melzeri]
MAKSPAGHSGHGGHGGHDKFNVAWFCNLLESAVEYMQTEYKHGEDPISSLPPSKEHEFLSQLSSAIDAGRHYVLAIGVLLLYEYLTTLDLEVELIWKRTNRSIIPKIFFLNRYLPLLTCLFVVVGIQWANTDRVFCSTIFAHLPSAMIVLCEICIGGQILTIIHTSWIDDPRRTQFSVVVLAVFLLQMSLEIACATALQGIGPLYGRDSREFGCFLIFQKGSMPRLVLQWFTSIMFNILIFYSIMRKSISIPMYKTPETNSMITGVVLRDVRLLLIVILCVHVVNLLMLVLFPYWNAINWFFSNMADVILTSRLLFNVRRELVSNSPTE